MYIFNDDMRNVLGKMKEGIIDCCITDCPYRIIAGGVRIIDEGDECSGVLSKRDYSKTDPKLCLNRGRITVSDGTNCSNKWLKSDNQNIPSAVRNGKMFEHNDVLFSEWLPLLYKVMKEGSHTYIMVNGRNLSELQQEAEICNNTEEEKEKIRRGGRVKRKGFIYQNLLIWDKGNLTPNKYYMQGAEFILFLRKGPAKNINDMGSSNIIRVKNIIGNKEHPTEKPYELYEYLLKNSTQPGDLVIDPFAGCGKAITISSKKLQLRYIAIELDKEYFITLKKYHDTNN